VSGLVGPASRRDIRAAARTPLVRDARRALAVALVASAGFALAIGTGAPDPGIAKRAFAACLAALILAVLVRLVAVRPRPRGEATFDTLIATPAAEPDSALRPLAGLEQAIRFATSSAGDYHVGLRPVLIDLVRHRLSSNGLRLEDPAQQARIEELISPALYELVRPGVLQPAERFAPGVPRAALESAVDTLEGLP
jgi:hypothetical protein